MATMACDHHSLIFTYGTLKRGFPNHPLMEDLIRSRDAVPLGPRVTRLPHPLVLGPFGIPFLVNLPGRGHRVRGELFSVSPRGLSRVDELEGIGRGHYERLPIEVEGDGGPAEAEAYFAHASFGEGLWRRRGEVGLSEYTRECAGEYVKRSERPKGWSFVESVREFVSSSPD
ncbi:putative gamma-glutamylcyclotransferase At3g02910 [Syzygium oleosum]|uniref:putative gamma-glutamylcyclotransferase At3g02910 n=1 Tax=Syzygium oleosum TaxID=219896 RepID=UPI0011D2264F|nr:putative gamma-glutamylcyclotransferase At3g02910 [Syzygium oleosum]XP_030457106.1 putative gamma-glutamylcyclotransferase At3g02910 [Syzygium oleosum]XP_056174529.1 putative gamma-glutamylcyclotransferase At3g02910 [Syzygium oleosum]XP_056174530.1 putative gamma-glutamylcyclotransferase At3g02910 [Syzygium oleosum]XP_056174531.1 putative gamma-glutamylcyclotransferase At3g02910 [Syzygium oleosum]